MLQQLEYRIVNDLQKGNICSLLFYQQKYPHVKTNDLLQTFTIIYRKDQNNKYDLLCHIVIKNQQSIRIQNQKFSNIQKGILHDNKNNSILFKKQHVKQFKILAIYPKDISIKLVQDTIDTPIFNKIKQYVSHSICIPKIIVQNPNQKAKSKKNDQKIQQNKQFKSQGIKKTKSDASVESHKGIKKTQSKSSIQQNKLAKILPKKIAKQQKPLMPVMTNYQAQRQKLQQQPVHVQKHSKKLSLDSDQQHYIPSKPQIFIKQLGMNQKNQETDHSAKKTIPQNQKMDIQSEGLKKPINFIVDDEDDEDDALFEQMQKLKDNRSEPKSESLTRPKTEQTKKVTPPPAAKKQIPKVVSVATKKTAVPAVTKKGISNNFQDISKWAIIQKKKIQ